MVIITKALIIDEPWITKILNGEKDWEMRSTSSRIRGPIGLIRKGSLQVVGIADFIDVSGPYDNEALVSYTNYHKIPSERFSQPDYKWRYAWELSNVKPLAEPASYIHKSGAVIWVELDEQAVENIARQLNGESFEAYLAKAPKADIEQIQIPKDKAADVIQSIQVEPIQSPPEFVETPAKPLQQVHSGLTLVPKAKDGSVFARDTCNNKGIYTVGNKGDEQKFRSFQDALHYLQTMPVARWRRKNINGTPGIVTAVDWVASETQ